MPAVPQHPGDRIFLGVPHLQAGRGHRCRDRHPPQSPPALLCPAPARDKGRRRAGGCPSAHPAPLGAAQCRAGTLPGVRATPPASTRDTHVLPLAWTSTGVRGPQDPQLWGRRPGCPPAHAPAAETCRDAAAAPAQANAKFAARDTIEEEVLPMQNSSGRSAGNKAGTAGAEPPLPTSPNRTGLPASPKPVGYRKAQQHRPLAGVSQHRIALKALNTYVIHVLRDSRDAKHFILQKFSIRVCSTAIQLLRNIPVSSFTNLPLAGLLPSLQG